VIEKGGCATLVCCDVVRLEWEFEGEFAGGVVRAGRVVGRRWPSDEGGGGRYN